MANKQFKISRRMRWNDRELSLIKNTFAEQEETLIVFRKFFFQGSLTKSELAYIKSYASMPEVLAVLKKAICPVVDKQAPPFQTVDLLSSIDFSTVPHEHAALLIAGRQQAITFLQQRFAELTGDEVKDPIDFDALTNPIDDTHQAHINMLTRNFLLSHVDTQLFNSLLVMAGTKDEDPADQKRRLSQDSSQ